MHKKWKKSLFIFRRDLRLKDNTGLYLALRDSEVVIPCFIFTPEQLEHNPYRSDHCLQFMLESLEDLNLQLKEQGSYLYLFYGRPHEIVEQCIQQLLIDAVIVNRDYTPYSIQRDLAIETVCKNRQVCFEATHDALLHAPEETLKTDGKPYQIFTPYFRRACQLEVQLPMAGTVGIYFRAPIPFAKSSSLFREILPVRSKQNRVSGGRTAALRLLRDLNTIEDYYAIRDFPAEDGTTHLSSYLKFTVCSPREVYAAVMRQLGKQHPLIRQLHWRDFFTSIAYFFPYVFGSPFHEKYAHLKWSDNADAFGRWCQGLTGFPIVDAGMREMLQTGFMHNRVRMVAASFLTKNLHIDWRLGEKYFAQTLIDYDPAVNNGNWQWAASVGCDAQPHFRIFNPWAQQQKFDPEARYIKRWIPELQSLTPKTIHHWYESDDPRCDYPPPMVDHQIEAHKAKQSYQTVLLRS